MILQSDLWGGARQVDGPCKHNLESYCSFSSFGAYADVKYKLAFGALACPCSTRVSAAATGFRIFVADRIM
jgi:hypothetical protein